MSAQTHRIRKQSWLVKTDTAADAFQVRKQLNEEWESSYLPAFEKAFDEICPEDEIIHIPRIALQLRVSPSHPEVLKEAIYRQVMEQLHTTLQQPGKSGTLQHPYQPGAYPARVLDFYLETGSLPWYALENDKENSATKLGELLLHEKETILQQILREEPGIPYYFRLVQLLSMVHGDQPGTAFAEFFSTLVPVSLMRFLTNIFETDIPGTSLHHKILFSSSLLERMDRTLDYSSETALFQLVHQAELGAELPATISGHWFRGFPVPPGTKGPVYLKDTMNVTSPGISIQEIPNTSPEPEPVPIRQNATTRAEKGQEQGILLFNAGLVLVHPFIGMLFEHCGITYNKETSWNPADLSHAAALLNYLGTGQDDPVEFDLGLIKVLLGLSTDDPVLVSKGILRESDREECDMLLLSMIQHWQALKNTSPEGLRQSFLLRSGLLYEDDAQWKLKIEPKPFDLLLGQLPWSISIIKLPWMHKPLFTEWPTP